MARSAARSFTGRGKTQRVVAYDVVCGGTTTSRSCPEDAAAKFFTFFLFIA
jgi:hypothetical protein